MKGGTGTDAPILSAMMISRIAWPCGERASATTSSLRATSTWFIPSTLPRSAALGEGGSGGMGEG